MRVMNSTVKHISTIQASLGAAGQQSAYWGWSGVVLEAE